MSKVLAIVRKELRVYTGTWTVWILGTALFGLTAVLFYLLVQEFQLSRLRYQDVRAAGLVAQMNVMDLVLAPLLSYLSTFLIFFAPLLTMRLFSEERTNGSMELLLTAPVRPWQVVLGKFAAGGIVVAALLGLTLVFPLSLDVLSSQDGGGDAVQWPVVLSGYLGLLLLSWLAVAVGLLASALSESQLIAAVVSFSILLLLTFAGSVPTPPDAAWGALLNYLAVGTHLEPFIRGLIRLTDVVYCLTFIGFALILTHRVFDLERWR